MLKMTSLVSVIALSELLYSAQTIYSRTFETIPLLLVACFWYLVLTTGLTLIQTAVERHLRRSDARGSGARPRWGIGRGRL
jgi:polar amino acid transport system permease protein